MIKVRDKEFSKAAVDDRLRRIANVLLLNASFIDNLGLLNGKMGIAIFFYHYTRYTQNKIFEEYAGELIDEIYEEINTNTPVDFANGLTGIGWGIGYLVENKFIDANTDEALADIDSAVYRNMLNNSLLLDNGIDFFGYGLYCISRLFGHENDDDNLNTLIKKEHLIYLTDECERLLVYKRYLEYNILQLSVATVNSLLWFLLEMDRLGLFPSKVKKVLKYLPDYISIGQGETNSLSDNYILNALSQNAVRQLTDEALRKQYTSLTEKTGNELKNIKNDDKSLSGYLQSVNLQKIVYKQYINGAVLNSESFEKEFEIIDNEKDWNRRLDGLNKSNLGLSGLAGVGLLLLDAIGSSRKSLINTSGSSLIESSIQKKK